MEARYFATMMGLYALSGADRVFFAFEHLMDWQRLEY